MIVRRAGGHLLLITQPDHAALSASILEVWRGDGLPDRASRQTVLFAAREHDNGWIEPDAAPEVDLATGRPYDFTNAPDAVKQAIWPRGIARLVPENAIAAALVAQHALTVLDHYRDRETWRQFFRDIQNERDDLLRQCGLETGEARQRFERDYALVYLGDLLSLILCNGWTEPVEAAGYRIILRNNTLHLSPDPFRGVVVPLRVRARRIADRRYSSGADLHEALSRGSETYVVGATAASAG